MIKYGISLAVLALIGEVTAVELTKHVNPNMLSNLRVPPTNSFISFGSVKYSDELANGDSADDREIHEEEDMNDDVVDVNGQTNRGYGSAVPSKYFAGNHIMAGSHITTPRDDGA